MYQCLSLATSMKTPITKDTLLWAEQFTKPANGLLELMEWNPALENPA